jgi:aubergine-like protein
VHRGVGSAPSSAGAASVAVASGSSASEPGAVEQLGKALSQLSAGPAGSNGSNGAAVASLGRGATRGRRDREEDFVRRTRPETLDSKVGKGGKPVQITTNHFNLVTKPDFRLYKYRVDMAPDVDYVKARKALLFAHEAILPAALFDGTLLFTDTRLAPDPMVLKSTRNDAAATVVMITIRLVEELRPSDYHYIQFFNIVLRRCMEGMELQLVRRDYFDPKARIEMKQYKLELWPGYVTTIKQCENSVMLCCEISHKVLRMDTVLEQIALISTRNRTNYRAACEKELLGKIVMTRYNNETYRIDDIAWEQHPTDSFESRKGGPLTFIQYYQDKYGRTIRDGKQPLIVSMPTKQDQRAGIVTPRLLVPELCNMTGLTDDQRADFNLMKAMGEYTRQDPEKRTRALKQFATRLENSVKAKEVMAKWNLRFSQDLASFRARCLDPEEILGAGSSKFKYKVDNADWSPAFRQWKQLSAPVLKKWVVLYPPKSGDSTKEFISCMKKVSPSLGMVIDQPKVFELPDQRPATYVQELNKVMEMGPNLVMIVIPNNKGDHYSVVKKICCIESPVPSQVSWLGP